MKVMPIRRDVKIRLQEEFISNWHEEGVHVTHFFNALSLLFPAGERMFMDAVRAYKDEVKDPELKKAVTAFIGQEALHSREHEEYNEMLDRAGLPAHELDKMLWGMLAFIQARLGKKMTLAGTVALEHYTALLANSVLKDIDGILGKNSAESFKQMWQWHSYEETEHKAVSYDVWNEVMPDNALNRNILRFAMILATVIFWPVVMYFHTRLVFADKQAKGKHIKGFWNVTKILWYKPGVLKNALGEFFDFFKAGFHPWDHDNSELLDEIDGFVQQVDKQERAANEEVRQAVRQRMAKKASASKPMAKAA